MSSGAGCGICENNCPAGGLDVAIRVTCDGGKRQLPRKDQKAWQKDWGQIKLVDPAFADLTCDIEIDPSLAPPKPAAPEVKTYIVKSGDTLSKLAKQFYGNASDYSFKPTPANPPLACRATPRR